MLFNADSSFSFTDGDEQKANQDTAHYLNKIIMLNIK